MVQEILERLSQFNSSLGGEDLMGIDGLITDLGIGKSVKMTGYAPLIELWIFSRIRFRVNLNTLLQARRGGASANHGSWKACHCL